mmetsp:Transcript_9395/g.23053  ORF Transcript_9395/g.23053 Transcript_9395/m.23053 type:complete len:317 (-) Transcript_9395:1072-2022(-)
MESTALCTTMDAPIAARPYQIRSDRQSVPAWQSSTAPSPPPIWHSAIKNSNALALETEPSSWSRVITAFSRNTWITSNATKPAVRLIIWRFKPQSPSVPTIINAQNAARSTINARRITNLLSVCQVEGTTTVDIRSRFSRISVTSATEVVTTAKGPRSASVPNLLARSIPRLIPLNSNSCSSGIELRTDAAPVFTESAPDTANSVTRTDTFFTPDVAPAKISEIFPAAVPGASVAAPATPENIDLPRLVKRVHKPGPSSESGVNTFSGSFLLAPLVSTPEKRLNSENPPEDALFVPAPSFTNSSTSSGPEPVPVPP